LKSIWSIRNLTAREVSLVLRELPPVVRDLFGKGLFDPMKLTALEALLERKYSEPLPKKNAKKGHITGIPPPTSTGRANKDAADVL